jgi:hypothetical protein
MPLTPQDFAFAGGDTIPFFANPSNALGYVNALTNRSANVQAGQKYAGGDYGGAANTLARSGNIAGRGESSGGRHSRERGGMQYLSPRR